MHLGRDLGAVLPRGSWGSYFLRAGGTELGARGMRGGGEDEIRRPRTLTGGAPRDESMDDGGVLSERTELGIKLSEPPKGVPPLRSL